MVAVDLSDRPRPLSVYALLLTEHRNFDTTVCDCAV